MTQIIVGSICALLFLLTLAVRRVYFCVPAKELKRLARAGDPAGTQLYRAVAFDGSLAMLLWFLVGAFATASFVLLAVALPWWVAAVAIASLLWLGFAWLAAAHPRALAVHLASIISPALAWMLGQTHRFLEPVNHFIRAHHRVLEHTGLYEKQDVVELFKQQKVQADSRVAAEDVELLQRVLELGDKTAGDIVLPRPKLRVVMATETIGPKLMDELHQSGLQYFPVCETSSERVIGLVRLDDLVRAKQGGSVEAVTDPNVCFVRDDFPLTQVLQAFRRTNQQLLIVINNFEEFLGVITIDQLLGVMMGKQATAPELAYDDRSAVANYAVPEPETTEAPPESANDAQPAAEN